MRRSGRYYFVKDLATTILLAIIAMCAYLSYQQSQEMVILSKQLNQTTTKFIIR